MIFIDFPPKIKIRMKHHIKFEYNPKSIKLIRNILTVQLYPLKLYLDYQIYSCIADIYLSR